jgi:hypothetical protein
MTEPAEKPATVPDGYPDPMKGFRGVMAGTLVLEAIVVALALLVIANLYGGMGTVLGILVACVAAAHVLLCGVLKRNWAPVAVLVLQALLIACFAGSTPVGVIGVLFGLIWIMLLWMRRDVARRMAAGRLPSQQPQP